MVYIFFFFFFFFQAEDGIRDLYVTGVQTCALPISAWVKDRSGKVSPVAVTRLLGMKSGIATTSTLVNYGGAVTIKGSLLRIDNKAYAGLPFNLYVRPKNSSTFK